MSTGNVHLIVTCTPRKTVPAGGSVFPDERNRQFSELRRGKLGSGRGPNHPGTVAEGMANGI